MYLNHFTVEPTIDAIKQSLISYGVLSIYVFANEWMSYETGILNNSFERNPRELNHAANLVGFGVENEKHFWIVRNTWSSDWGENGYIRITMNPYKTSSSYHHVYGIKDCSFYIIP